VPATGAALQRAMEFERRAIVGAGKALLGAAVVVAAEAAG
jgi:hypothetical protein